MRIINTRGSILLYAILLANFAVILAYVIFINSQELVENSRYSEVSGKMAKNIEEKAVSAFDYDLLLNGDGSGFTNAESCPALTMSGTAPGSAYQETIPTTLAFNGVSYTCSGTSTNFSGNSAVVSYQTGYTSFSGITFLWVTASLTGTSTLSGTLADANRTLVHMSNTGVLSGIDGNGNSDDFRAGSTGMVQYPNGYADNDDLARKTAYGYIRKDSGWRSVYWNSPMTLSYIRANSNNTGALALFPDVAGNYYLSLDVDHAFSLRIIEFDTTSYANSKELKMLNSVTATFPEGRIGYLQSDLSFATTTTAAKPFDLKDHMYGVFLSWSGSTADFFKYRLSFTNAAGTALYSVPIDDSVSGILKYLGNEILIDADSHFIGKEMEIVRNR